MTQPAVGDTTFLNDYFINTRVYGVVTLGPPEFLATYEIQGDQGSLLIAVAVGPEGPPGQNMFAMTLQNDSTDSVSNLPKTLQNSSADIGKYWVIDDIDANGDIIGSSIYVWYGTTFKRLTLGSPGPQGPVPVITPQLNVLPPNQSNSVTQTGNAWTPTLTFNISAPAGPQGPAAALALCPDVDFTTAPPQAGDVLGFTGSYQNGLLSPPSGLLGIVSSTGGTLAAGTYYYVVTSVNSNGETTASNEIAVTTTGSTSKITLDWNAGGRGNFSPTAYHIYRGTTAGGENSQVASVSAPAAGTNPTFIDTGGSGTGGGIPPSVNTATISLPVWTPVSISQLMPSPYSMPEASFTQFSGISQMAPIGSFSIPPQSFDWTPIVWGHIGAFGIELSTNPLMIGCEVLLGDPGAGQQIARGFGNSLGEVNIMPHYSTPNQTGAAITPYNGTAVVPAHHSNPAQGTIYVNLYNDGQIGLYSFHPTDAQIFIMLVPV